MPITDTLYRLEGLTTRMNEFIVKQPHHNSVAPCEHSVIARASNLCGESAGVRQEGRELEDGEG